jgi:hypothetical protein
MHVRETLPELRSVRDRHAQVIAEAEAQGLVHPALAAPIRAVVAAFDKQIADITASSR